MEQPVYKFMTDEQLQEALSEANKKADELLQMPPVLPVRQPIDSVLSRDPALKGLEMSRLIFTDITFGIPDSQRLIVIREPDGTLLEADWSLRDHINQVYFPSTGRKLKVPKMFEGDFLKDVLSREEYEFVLDRACVQFEPDDPNYQRVTSSTYEHVSENRGFDKLRSTRHFGPLVFYLTWHNCVDNLLLDLIETCHIEEANNLMALYGKIHNVDLNVEDEESLGIIKQYILKFSNKKGPLELALQAYKDLEHQKKELERGIKAAHGN